MYLDRIAISAAFRRRGIGRDMYAEVERLAAERRPSAKDFALEVNLRPRNDEDESARTTVFARSTNLGRWRKRNYFRALNVLPPAIDRSDRDERMYAILGPSGALSLLTSD